MMLANFWGMLFRCQKWLFRKNQFASAKLFLFYIYNFNVQMWKMLIECFANAISLRLNKIIFASFKNFIIIFVASHILCAN